MAEVFHSPHQDGQQNSDTESTSTSSYLKYTLSDEDYQPPNTSAPQYSLPSRPLSRSSVTSGLSVTATKDGIEGKRIKRHGIPGYPLNLIEKMYASYVTQSRTPVDDDASYPYNDKASIESIKSQSMSSMIPQYSRLASPDSIEDGNYGDNTLELERNGTDYEQFLQRNGDDQSLGDLRSLDAVKSLDELKSMGV